MKFRVKRRPRFRIPRPKRTITRNGFFGDCDSLLTAMFASKFFHNLDKITDERVREAERIARYRARRAANEAKALRILHRLRRVEAIDLYLMTQHIEPDWFGEKDMQFSVVKELHVKKARIVWFLKGLYRYLAFDQEVDGWAVKRGFHYKRHRAYYLKHMENHAERVRQQKWDLKRAKVRTRRKKLIEKGVSPQQAALYALRRGMGNNIPVPIDIGADEVNWDD